MKSSLIFICPSGSQMASRCLVWAGISPVATVWAPAVGVFPQDLRSWVGSTPTLPCAPLPIEPKDNHNIGPTPSTFTTTAHPQFLMWPFQAKWCFQDPMFGVIQTHATIDKDHSRDKGKEGKEEKTLFMSVSPRCQLSYAVEQGLWPVS